MEGLTRQVGAFAASVRRERIPDSCIEGARIGIADCVGVMLAGVHEAAPRIVAAQVAGHAGADSAPQIPTGRMLPVADAALVNGVAAHVLDYDDVALAGHPSVALVPAILAEGWALGRSGADMLTAYVAGYETWALLDALEPGSLHELGFHPTAVLGTVGAAAACASLHRLSADQAAHAVAISASLAGGMVANFGSMTKSLQVGRAAQSGVTAARLAKAGYTASLDVLEHRTGFMRAHSPSREPDLAARDYRLGSDWRLPDSGVHVKRYPICYATHRSIDAMLELVESHAIEPDDVTGIHVQTGDTQLLMLRNAFPQTGLEAKFSMQFAMAAAIVAKRVGLAELTDEFVRRDDVRALMKRVRCTTTTERVQGWDQPFAPFDRVSVVLASGAQLHSRQVERPKGSWQRRLGEDELRAKFIDCATRSFDSETSGALFEQLWSLDALASVRDLRVLSESATQQPAHV
ncbi:MmgE/PrpD family protein [Paraburkholderia caballeronis]|uniref:2-methylcitrate dehydratase PrpD n=1 Tax=Paraburkholderia caballeronis TaxID=416943 RepID=A0A1H7FKI8_9BURK|nr:MmgE/PrpD family protein [Paraburkholderia caballeronis]PXW25027.1 2-methylcitrate dehydratase PrpD [Paraburkholderia caballeronis]PXW93211.1 2-methylcitrate dehydratase PrpD [Paraburkholderia caballeronis]RAJ86662.1 2-methylcitrate dehydratase PrpD [Paraburkholderia caballeronis]SEE73483.1 2-methylcitrate dehydratase PrpD [Paraburkholderia caballeronis]SEK24640.1 2-methylcitrate dehydratase PrpD [Paraburkholderia caballeronis]